MLRLKIDMYVDVRMLIKQQRCTQPADVLRICVSEDQVRHSLTITRIHVSVVCLMWDGDVYRDGTL